MTTPQPSVVYVSLGGRRTRAARRYAADLAGAGARVLLVVANRPAWADTAIGGGVTVHRLAATQPPQALREARRFLLARRGPLADAELLVVGDAESAPLADLARRRFSGLKTFLTPTPEPDRRPAPADLAVITPWYPCPNDAFAGAFVRAATAALGGTVGRVSTLHTENWFYSPKGIAGKLLGVSIQREIGHTGGVVVEDTAEGELSRVITPQLTNGNYAIWVQSQIDRLRAALPTGRIEAPLVHAHTGHYAGVVATALARDDARIVVSEHATFLADVFAHRGARRLYGEMLARANRMLCVSRSLKEQIAEAFPEHVEKLRIVPNPIDFDRFAVRPEPPKEPLRWLYVGRMLEHKGVRTLVDGFARIADEEPRATLTLVGSGALEGPLRERIAELGLADRIIQRPAVRPEEVADVMRDHDVLTHASTVETFGVTLVEAIATGTPVMAARSQGPAETLEALSGVAGVLFPVTDDPEVVAAAYRRLRDEWGGLNLAAARERLRARYGREAVGAQLREVYRQVLAEPADTMAVASRPVPPPVPAPGTDRITVVAVETARSGRVVRYIDVARERGYAIDLITADPARWGQYAPDAGVRIHGIGDAEERRLTRRLERGLVVTFPRWAFGFARARAQSLRSPLPEAVAIHAQRGQRVLAKGFDSKVYGRWYHVVRPRILWRITRRRVLPELDLAHTRTVVVNGTPGVTIGWGLAKRDPAMAVSTDLTPPTEDAGVHP